MADNQQLRLYTNKEWLEKQYKSYTVVEIAKLCDVSIGTIYYWLDKHSIRNPQYKWTDEMKETARKRSQQYWQNNYEQMAHRSDEQKQKISESLKQKWETDTNFRNKTLDSIAEAKYSSRGVIIEYKPIKSIRSPITFRSLTECAYAMLLDNDTNVVSWEYETIKLKYKDNYSGKQKVYVLDFKVIKTNITEHIEIKPAELQEPLTKYLYAENNLDNWRFITNNEFIDAIKLFKSGYNINKIKFIHRWPKARFYVAWSKTGDVTVPDGWRQKIRHHYGVYFRHRFISLTNTERKHFPNESEITVDKIINLVKINKLQYEIANELNIDQHTINNILERNSYYVKWSFGRGDNILYYAGQQVWPELA